MREYFRSKDDVATRWMAERLESPEALAGSVVATIMSNFHDPRFLLSEAAQAARTEPPEHDPQYRRVLLDLAREMSERYRGMVRAKDVLVPKSKSSEGGNDGESEET